MKKDYQRFICILLLIVMIQVLIFQRTPIVYAEELPLDDGTTYICNNLPLNDGIVYDCNDLPLNAGGTEAHYEALICTPYTGEICNICNNSYHSSACAHYKDTVYNGTECSPSVRICNICGGNYPACGHVSGTTYGGTVCSPSGGICNICHNDYYSSACSHTSGQTYGSTVCSPSASYCNICGGNYPTCGHSSGTTYGGTLCSPSGGICNICHNNYYSSACGHISGATYGGTVCSPGASYCNICGGNYPACGHSSGTTYGGTVCSPYSVRICNICSGNYATCPHTSGTTYGGTVCSPSGGICNICGGNYATCPHYSGTVYGGTVCSPYTVNYCNICSGNYATCPHTSGTVYGGTVCSPSPRICNICDGNYPSCGHVAGLTYGGTVCSPNPRICNICGTTYGTCNHQSGFTYGGIVCSPSTRICNICSGSYPACGHITGSNYGGTVCSPSTRVCNICSATYGNCGHQSGFTYGGIVCTPSPQYCNICCSVYGECSHVQGQIYGGTVCVPYAGDICNVCNNVYNLSSCSHEAGQNYGQVWVPATSDNTHVHNDACQYHFITHKHTEECLWIGNSDDLINEDWNPELDMNYSSSDITDYIDIIYNDIELNPMDFAAGIADGLGDGYFFGIPQAITEHLTGSNVKKDTIAFTTGRVLGDSICAAEGIVNILFGILELVAGGTYSVGTGGIGTILGGLELSAAGVATIIYNGAVVSTSVGNLVTDTQTLFSKVKSISSRVTRKPSDENPNFISKEVLDDGSIKYTMKTDSGRVIEVTYNRDGCPDFSSYKYKGSDGLAEAKVICTGNRITDIRLANEAAGFSRTPSGFTWHHMEDGQTMMLVETEVHRLFAHTGGFALH